MITRRKLLMGLAGGAAAATAAATLVRVGHSHRNVRPHAQAGPLGARRGRAHTYTYGLVRGDYLQLTQDRAG